MLQNSIGPLAGVLAHLAGAGGGAIFTGGTAELPAKAVDASSLENIPEAEV